MKHIQFTTLLLALCAAAFIPQTACADNTEHHYLTTLNIIYAESMPNTKEEGTGRGKFKAIFKRFDSVEDVPVNPSTERKADALALKNGYTELPAAAFDALIKRLEAYHVKAAPIIYSNIRKKDELEAFKKELAKKHPPLPGKSDFVLDLLPYQTVYADPDNVVVWIGAVMFDMKKKKNRATTLNYLTVPFGAARKGLNAKDADRLASVLIDSMVEHGFLPKKPEPVSTAKR